MIGGFRSNLSIIRKTDGNFGNVSAGVSFPKSCINKNGGKMKILTTCRVVYDTDTWLIDLGSSKS